MPFNQRLHLLLLPAEARGTGRLDHHAVYLRRKYGTYTVSMSSDGRETADAATAHTESRAAGPPEQGTRPARRRRARGRGRHRGAHDARARAEARRRGDVALQPRGQQGRRPRRHGRPGRGRDRPAVRHGRLEGGHAPEGDLGPGGLLSSPLGERPDRFARELRRREAALLRVGDRDAAARRILLSSWRRARSPSSTATSTGSDGSSPTCRPGAGPSPRTWREAFFAIPADRVPVPQRARRRARHGLRLRRRSRSRVRARPHSRWAAEAAGHSSIAGRSGGSWG